jgi:hypothetical protein
MPACAINGGWVSGDDRIERGPVARLAFLACEAMTARIVALFETASIAFSLCHRWPPIAGLAFAAALVMR